MTEIKSENQFTPFQLKKLWLYGINMGIARVTTGPIEEATIKKADLTKLVDELEKAWKALEFYADERNWDLADGGYDWWRSKLSEADKNREDGSKRAKEALNS